MIYEKRTRFPKTTTRKLRFKGCSLFRERENMLTAESSLHFRPDGDFLVCGEGGEEITFGKMPKITYFRVDRNGLLLHDGVLLYRVRNGAASAIGELKYPLLDAVEHYSKEGEYVTYAVTEEGVYNVGQSVFWRVSAETGGVCCAQHYERLFTANGYRVRYSRALNFWDWRESPRNAGFLDLPAEGGNIIAMVSYKEKLYLFRERGISQLRALGDPMNFKAITIPFSCGKIIPHSVVNCGEKILFLTDNGLYAFNGGVCTRAKGCGAHLWDLSDCASATCCKGRYYACVRTQSGEKRLFSYDCEEETGYLMQAKAELLSCYENAVYYLEEGKLFRITDCGFREGERAECVVKTELSSFGLSDGTKYLDGITLGGKGYFRVRAENERGEGCAVYGKAGENLRFPCPVRGNAFSLKISAYTEGVRLGEIALTVREEG